MFTGYRYILKNECQDTWSIFDKALLLYTYSYTKVPYYTNSI